MPVIKILAVEDEELHADLLRMHLDKLDYQLIALLDDAKDVLSVIRATKPDVVLMDIVLNGVMNGIELASRINEVADVPVIYLTSHRDMETFQAAKKTFPESYLTKPYDTFQLQSAIELAILKNQQVARPPISKHSESGADSLFVKEGTALSKVSFSDILYVQAFDKYCYVHTAEKKFLMGSTLKAVSANLPVDTFIQVHRSYIINLSKVEKIVPAESTLLLAGKPIPVSRAYKTNVFSHFNII